jgi:hypothetical protein
MRFLPQEKYEIETSIPLQEVKKRIETLIVAKPSHTEWLVKSFKHILLPGPENQFTGEVTNDGFRLIRLIYYQNSFIPTIEGRFLTNSFGTKLELKMMLLPSTIAFTKIWLIGTSLMFLLLTPFLFKDHFHPEILLVLVMPLSMLAMAHFGFRREARKALKIISSLFPNARKQVTASDSVRGSSGAPLETQQRGIDRDHKQ